MSDLRHPIRIALQSFATMPLHEAATNLLKVLGYSSDRRLDLGDSSPETFVSFINESAPHSEFDEVKAMVAEWKAVHLLFQLTDQELIPGLFRDTKVKVGLLRSYVFIAIDLVDGPYPRGRLTGIARQINRAFPMPVMVLLRHHLEDGLYLSIAVINRRQNKREVEKDVLGKVTIIRDISLSEPHRGHLDILNDLAKENLVHPSKLPINNFDTLHAAWEEVLNVELLNKRFYRELSYWYFWALGEVDFPDDVEKDAEKRRATGLIRLITRLIFCWFLKEKGLIPETLFEEVELKKILKSMSPEDSTYYQAILQNLFFATLNQPMVDEETGKPLRAMALDEGFKKNRNTYGVDTLYRYEEHFKNPNGVVDLFAKIPFLNGGLFECLDRTEEGTNRKLYIDGFSRSIKKRPRVPNDLFFGRERKVDLSAALGESGSRYESVRGLLHVLHGYKFTIVENTPIDQEIALDPELLGKVFENLLASYNEETKTTARKQTGSFYTPRPIVEYMVDEVLRSYLTSALVRTGMAEEDARVGLELLFLYTEQAHPFEKDEVDTLLDAIHTCKILDPACGSGAFPMGVLHKLVYIIHKLDPHNAKWKELQLEKAAELPDYVARLAAEEAVRHVFEDNDDDYGRKLYLIENCLYGVDIQPIAIQIAKLRFFISLIVDQRIHLSKPNYGIRPLPNLETKFVVADTLIALPAPESTFRDLRIEKAEAELKNLYHRHFTVQQRREKLALQQKAKDVRKQIAKWLNEAGISDHESAQRLAVWDPFDPQMVADFFDPHWMFGIDINSGFDIVLGNPPYVQIQKFSVEQKALWQEQRYSTYTATADIYCLFYERGARLLRSGGHLCFITSNKWMRAGYGDLLRDFLADKVDTTAILDFGMAQNFGAATTYTCITQFRKQNPTDHVYACYATDDRAAMSDPGAYFEEHSVLIKSLNSDPWVVISPERQRVKDLVEAQGIPLGKWDIEINYGIKTGFNDAFYISNEQRNAFISQDPSCEKLLVPLLRGRHIERYSTSWDGTWMINTHNGVKALGIPRVNLETECPTLWHHMLRWEKRLKKRQDKGDHWSNLRNCAYLLEFSKPKIMYPNMTKYLPFYYDNYGEFYLNQKGFIITSDSTSLCFLTANLNSSLFRCCFRDNFPELLGNTYELSKIFVDKIPLKKPSILEAALFEKLVPLVQLAKRIDYKAAATFLEDLIDACVMECYFREHMAERDLLFQNDIIPQLASYDCTENESRQHEFLEKLYRTLNASDSKIRNRLIRLTADSPELLAVIKAEGRV